MCKIGDQNAASLKARSDLMSVGQTRRGSKSGVWGFQCRFWQSRESIHLLESRSLVFSVGRFPIYSSAVLCLPGCVVAIRGRESRLTQKGQAFRLCKLLFLNDYIEFFKKMPCGVIFHLRVLLVILRTPFTGAAEAVLMGRIAGLTDWKDG